MQRANNPYRKLPLMRAPSILAERLDQDAAHARATGNAAVARYTWMDDDNLLLPPPPVKEEEVSATTSAGAVDALVSMASVDEPEDDSSAAAAPLTGLPPLPPELLQQFRVKSILVKDRKYAPSDEPVPHKERTHRLTWDEPKNACVFISPYDRSCLEQWFYTDDDFEEFERDACRKPVKKRAGSGGRKKRARTPPSPARAMGVEAKLPIELGTPASEQPPSQQQQQQQQPVLYQGLLDAAVGALHDYEATGQTLAAEEAHDENEPEAGNVAMQKQLDAADTLMPPAKRRVQAQQQTARDEVATTSFTYAEPSLYLPPTAADLALKVPQLPPMEWGAPAPTGGKVPMGANPFEAHAVAAATAAAARAGLPPRRATGPPSPRALEPIQSSTFTVGAAPPPSLKARRGTRENGFAFLGIEDLKDKIRQVASNRRERLQQGVN